MKTLLVLSALFAVNAFAQEGKPNFADQKKQILEHISAQMAALETTKKCVESSADQGAIKKCHEMARDERRKFEGQKIDDQIKRLEEKKKALEEKKK